MTFALLQQKLLIDGPKKFKFKINDNRSTMLSVKWEPDCTRVSMHRMFLEAPGKVVDELVSYLRQEQKNISPTIREFIEVNLRKLDYSHLLNPERIVTNGQVYDLKLLFQKINQKYFEGKLQLSITWFGKHNQKTKSQITFGLYHDQLKLVKINRILDHIETPAYVVEFVVYHEMVHSVCPGYFDEKGRHRVHSKEFKSLEMQFQEYHEALYWLKKHYTNHFEGF